jgi:hypothetical protein
MRNQGSRRRLAGGLALLSVLLLSFGFVACGGDDADEPSVEQGSSNWDELIWDQDDWA